MEKSFPVWAVKYGDVTDIFLAEEDAWLEFYRYYQKAQAQVQEDGMERRLFITSKPITLREAFTL